MIAFVNMDDRIKRIRDFGEKTLLYDDVTLEALGYIHEEWLVRQI